MSRPRSRPAERGAALPYAIVFVVILTTAIGLACELRLARAERLRTQAARLQARYAAEAGVAAAIDRLRAGQAPPLAIAGTLGSASYRAEVAPGAPGTLVIRAEGDSDGVSLRVRVEGVVSGAGLAIRRWDG